MGGRKPRSKKPDEPLPDEQEIARIVYDDTLVRLGFAALADIHDYPRACSFKSCRLAGRCQAFQEQRERCAVPLDTARAMIFAGMILFHDRFNAEVKGWVRAPDSGGPGSNAVASTE